jgi:hypothetical protein
MKALTHRIDTKGVEVKERDSKPVYQSVVFIDLPGVPPGRPA